LPDGLARLREQGIKLRDATSFGLPGHVRLGVLSPEAQDALHNAWCDIVKGHQ
jgi:histidinol-phosphate aminotransferase